MNLRTAIAGIVVVCAGARASVSGESASPAADAPESAPAWAEAGRRPPFTAEEARGFMRRLALFVREHHLKTDEGSPQRGMVYEYRDMRAEDPAERFVQGEALDTMHDGAWLAAAMASAFRASGEPIYREMLVRWQLPFYLRMLNGSDALFSTREVHVRPDRRGVWSRSKLWLLQDGEKGFVPYWWDDGASISLERHAREPLPPYPCFDEFLHRGAENPRFALAGYSLGCSNHMAQDLAVMLQTSWLLLRDAPAEADRSLAAEVAEAARNLHESRIRHHGFIPMCAAAAALAAGDEEMLARVPDPASEIHWRPDNAYWRGLRDFEPEERISVPGFADDQQYTYYHGVARAGGELPKPLAFRLIYDALTIPLLYRCYSDDAPAPPGIHRFDLHPYHAVNGRMEDYRSDRRGPGGRPRPAGSRLGPQNLIVCGWALQALDAYPGIWDEAVRRQAPDDLRVPVYDEALGPPPAGKEAIATLGGATFILSASRNALRIHGSAPSPRLRLRIHARPDAQGPFAELSLERDGSASAVNDHGDALVLDGTVEPSGEGMLYRLELPATVVKGQAAWANIVELGRCSIAAGGEHRNICLASPEERVRALLRRELAGGLRTWEAIFDTFGYVPTCIGAGRAGAAGRWEWEQLSDSGGYAHLISAAAQWIFCLTKQRDWETLGVRRGEAPSAPGEGRDIILGYILRLPPEPAAERQRRLDLVARRRAVLPVLVHRGASAIAPENTLEAYAAAMDRGADGIEVDIRRSRDGVLYCIHDDTLDRTTRGTGPVKDLTYHEILKAGIRGAGEGRDAPRVPTFAAVLALARRRAALLHLDVKEAGLQTAIQNLLDEGDLWDHVVAINPGNAEQLCAHPRARLLAYKGWFPEGEPPSPDAVTAFLERPGDMVFCKNDPAPVVRALGREVPRDAEAMPAELRLGWTPVGPAVQRRTVDDDKEH